MIENIKYQNENKKYLGNQDGGGDADPLVDAQLRWSFDRRQQAGEPSKGEEQKCVSLERLKVEGANGRQHDSADDLQTWGAETVKLGEETVDGRLEEAQERFDEDDVAEPPVVVRGEQLDQGVQQVQVLDCETCGFFFEI